MISNLKNNLGLTLIEVLLAVLIASIVFSLAFSLQLFGLRSYSMGTSQAEIQQNARLIDEVLRRELRNSTYIGDDTEEGVRAINFSSNTLDYGVDNSINIEGINSLSFERKNDQTLRYIITGNGYQFVKEIFLNNVSISNETNMNLPLRYSRPID